MPLGESQDLRMIGGRNLRQRRKEREDRRVAVAEDLLEPGAPRLTGAFVPSTLAA